MSNMPVAIHDYSENFQKTGNADISELQDYKTFIGKMKDNVQRPEITYSPRRKTITPRKKKRDVEPESGDRDRREGN